MPMWKNGDAQDRWRRTPLHWAALNGHYSTVAALLLLPSQAVRLADNAGETALHLACRCQLEEEAHQITLALVKARAEVNARQQAQRTALHLAVMNTCCSVVQALLKSRADPSLTDAYGVKPECEAYE